MSQIDEIIQPVQTMLDGLRAEVKAYDDVRGQMITTLVESSKQLVLAQLEIERTRQLVGARLKSEAEVRELNHPRAEKARSLISDVEIARIEAAIPQHIATRGAIESKVRVFHNLLIEIIKKLEHVETETRGLLLLPSSGNDAMREEIATIRRNLSLIKQE